MKIIDQKLKNLNVVIVSHIFATGPALELEEYLKAKVKSLLFIGHPFEYKEGASSFLRHYKNSNLIESKNFLKIKIPGILLYLKELFLTIWWVFKKQPKADIYIGSDNYSAYIGLILKKMDLVKEVILYTIDYMPIRFENKLLNKLYHFFDYQCLKNCKIVWNVSARIEQARLEYKGIDKNFAPQIVVPLGIWHKRIPKFSIDKKIRNRLVFMGHLLEKQGVDLVIQALPLILKRISGATLLIIGTGPYENHLKQLVKKERIEKSVIFTGYIEDHREVEKELSKSLVALAMYKPDPKSFTYFADPGKIKNYLASGLPVVLTDVPPIAKDLVASKCGIISQYNKEDFAKEVINLLLNKKMLNIYSKNAIVYSQQFDWERVFSQALYKSLN